MKRLFLLNIMLVALIAPAHAATIQAYATEVNATSGSFSATAGGAAISDAEVQAIITSNAGTALSGYYPSDYLFGSSATTYSEIDLGFGDTTVKTGSGGDTLGADLVVVSLWNDNDYRFGLKAFDVAGNLLSFYQYMVTDATPDSCDSTGACVKTTSINLYSNDYSVPVADRELADNIEIGYISLLIGGTTFNGAGGLDGYSNFSLVGAYHTDAVVVPLPLPAILFSSGLLLLGWVGRRKAV